MYCLFKNSLFVCLLLDSYVCKYLIKVLNVFDVIVIVIYLCSLLQLIIFVKGLSLYKVCLRNNTNKSIEKQKSYES